MRKQVPAIMGMLMIALAASPTPAGTPALSAYRWHHRVLLIFAPAKDGRALAAQRTLLGGAARGLAERDVLVLTVAGDEVEDGSSGATAAPSATALRREYDAAPDAFLAILIGKDGGEKLRVAEPIRPERLFATIDRMPMRRQEQRAQAPHS